MRAASVWLRGPVPDPGIAALSAPTPAVRERSPPRNGGEAGRICALSSRACDRREPGGGSPAQVGRWSAGPEANRRQNYTKPG